MLIFWVPTSTSIRTTKPQKTLISNVICLGDNAGGSQYDYTITYIKGEDNTVADTMSRLPDDFMTNSPLPIDPDNVLLAGVFSIAADDKVLQTIKDRYRLDPFCVKLNDTPDSCPGLRVVNRLIYLGDRLIIPPFSCLPMTRLAILDLRSRTVP